MNADSGPEYHYVKQGRVFGPVPERSVRAWLESGFLRADDLVWREPLAEWARVNELPEFGGNAGLPPPVFQDPTELYSDDPEAVAKGYRNPPDESARREGADARPPAGAGVDVTLGDEATPSLPSTGAPAAIERGAPPMAQPPIQPWPQASRRAPVVVYAEFSLRVLAFLIDNVIMTIVLILMLFPRVIRMAADPEKLAQDPVFFVASLTLALFYYTIFEASPWQATPGKRALRMRVCDVNGGRLRFVACLIRQMAKVLGGLTLYIGYFIASVTSRRQALHDLLAGSLVVRER